jgi:uncharacterized membrane protein YedE/YeeE
MMAVGGALLGLLYGYASQRGAFCMNSGFRMAAGGDFTKVKALALAVAVQAVILPVFFALGWASPAALPFQPLAGVVGGLLFGASMRPASGCAAGAWYKLGAGSSAAIPAFLGLAAGAWLFQMGPAAPLRLALQSVGAVPAWSMAPSWAGPALGLVLLWRLSWASPGRAGAWSWQHTGLVVGLVALAAWPLSALAGRNFGLAAVPGALDLLTGRLWTWDALFVLAIPLGAYGAARQAGPVSLRLGRPAELATALAAGLMLGASASLASGCTVGHGLAGLALAAPQSALVMASIFAGSALESAWRSRGAVALAAGGAR